MDPKEPRAGEPVSASLIAWMLRAIKRLLNIRTSPELGVKNLPNGIYLYWRGDAGTTIFPASINGHTGTAHGWTEVNARGSVVSGGRTGTATANPAFDLYNRVFADGTLVYLVQSTYVDSLVTKPAMAIIPVGPMPTAKNQVFIAKDDPDNALKEIPEWNHDRFRGP